MLRLPGNYGKREPVWTTIPGFFDFADVYQNFVTRCRDGDIVVEVGCYLGRSVCFLGEEIQTSGKRITVLAVDAWPSTYRHGDGSGVEIEAPFETVVANVRQAGLKDIVFPIRAKSLVAARFVVNDLAAVFIDAEHDYKSCLDDITAWTPKVRRGGIIAGHDYDPDAFPGVVKAAQEYFGARLHSTGRCWYADL